MERGHLAADPVRGVDRRHIGRAVDPLGEGGGVGDHGFELGRRRRAAGGVSAHGIEDVDRAYGAEGRHHIGPVDRRIGAILVRALLAHKRGEPRVCAMAKAPTAEQEDCRQISRERRSLTAERVKNVNRIKGLLFAQGITEYEPVRRDRRQ